MSHMRYTVVVFFTFVLPGPLKVIVSSDQKLDIGKRK